MVSELWLNPTVCFLLSRWLNAFVPTLGVPINRIFLFPKSLHDYALITIGASWFLSTFLQQFLLNGAYSSSISNVLSHKTSTIGYSWEHSCMRLPTHAFTTRLYRLY